MFNIKEHRYEIILQMRIWTDASNLFKLSLPKITQKEAGAWRRPIRQNTMIMDRSLSLSHSYQPKQILFVCHMAAILRWIRYFLTFHFCPLSIVTRCSYEYLTTPKAVSNNIFFLRSLQSWSSFFHREYWSFSWIS